MQEVKPNSHHNGEAALRWLRTAWPILLVALGLTAQWGALMARFGAIEDRMADVVAETRALRTEIQQIEGRVSYLEGRQNARSGP
jgi:hypothetical protein